MESGAGIAPFRSGMFIETATQTPSKLRSERHVYSPLQHTPPSSARSGMGCGAGRLPPAHGPIYPARTHAAPIELMVFRRPDCYKHAAPDGAVPSRHADGALVIQQLLAAPCWGGAAQRSVSRARGWGAFDGLRGRGCCHRASPEEASPALAQAAIPPRGSGQWHP